MGVVFKNLKLLNIFGKIYIMITIEEVKKIAKLARINLTENEEKMHAETISVVLDYMKILDEIDILNIEPTLQVTGLENVMRDDIIVECEYSKELIEQMPDVQHDRLRVPGVFENSDDV